MTIKGQIDFKSVCLRYNTSSPFALKNITFCIKAGQKVGIIGRTGAGKSSIFHVSFLLLLLSIYFLRHYYAHIQLKQEKFLLIEMQLILLI